jgi:hypothetical protein
MATWDRYTSPVTSLEVQSRIGAPFYIRSFCDDPLGSVYVSKAPVCKLSLDPITQFVDTNVAWDISASRSASGTIDHFDIDWDGATDIGDLSAQDWASDPKSGNVQFTTAGTYLVEATVTDTLGNESRPQRITVEIIDDDASQALEQTVYIGTTDGGLYILEPGGAPVASNNGLVGDDLKFRALRLHPAYRGLPAGRRHLWAATATGVAVSVDGGASWSLTDRATLGDPSGSPTSLPTAYIDQIDLAFDPQDARHVLLFRTGTIESFLYETFDYGATWAGHFIEVS